LTVSYTLEKIKSTRGTKDKMSLLLAYDSPELRQALKYAMDGFINFHVVKVPKVKSRVDFPLGAPDAWREFFRIADMCAKREITGNAAVDAIYTCFCTVDEKEEKWMRNVLKKKFSIGLATKSVNKVFPALIETFEVQLAEKMTERVMKKLPNIICIEPKLDGIRCLAVVRESSCEIFARSGKQISNFNNTIGSELSSLPDGVYDGEIMDEDFVALMRQVHRKEGADVSNSYLVLFDCVSLEEWNSRSGIHPLRDRRKNLERCFLQKEFTYLRLVEQESIEKSADAIDQYHHDYVEKGYEGAMVKNPDRPYSFGRSDAVIKVKSFFDVDLMVIDFKEGTGRHTGKLGSILVDFAGVDVNVGSGFDDDMRVQVWDNRDEYVGMTAEVRYQEITPDGSLRFPTFVCWRTDK